MKVVYNDSCGGFGLPDEFLAHHPEYVIFSDSKELRTNVELIECVEKYKDSGYRLGWGTKLRVANLPDNTTDFYIKNYNDVETILYVVDGKIEEF